MMSCTLNFALCSYKNPPFSLLPYTVSSISAKVGRHLKAASEIPAEAEYFVVPVYTGKRPTPVPFGHRPGKKIFLTRMNPRTASATRALLRLRPCYRAELRPR